MKTKHANELNQNDKLIRFGHVLKIKTIIRRIHPLVGVETVSVNHESGTVDYMPTARVEVK